MIDLLLTKLSWPHSFVVWKILKPAWVVSMSWCEKVNYRILYLSLPHYSACASIAVQKSGHFLVPIYQRLRKDQFHAPIDQLCREVYGNFYVPFEQLSFGEEHGNVHLPFAKFSQFTLFLTVCLVFGSYKNFGAFEYQKSLRFLPFWQIIPI